MKKITFTLILSIVSLWGFSQITITNANMAPEGTTIIQANDTLPDASIVPGNSGSNQTWDFSAATADYFDTLYTELPSWTPYADSFPDANYVLRQTGYGDTTYVFANKNDDYFATLGYVGSLDDSSMMALNIVPQEIIMDFPVAYGNQRNESFYYQKTVASDIPGYDSIRFKTSTSKSVEVDGWGTIIMPTGSYNCLRTLTNRTDYDSVWLFAVGNWILVSSDSIPEVTFNWYTNEILPGFDLFSMDYTDGMVSNVSFLHSTTVGIQQQNNLTATIQPNPVQNNTTLQLSDMVRGEVRLYNQAGMLVNTMAINGTSAMINMESLPAGLYIVMAFDTQKQRVVYTGKIVKK